MESAEERISLSLDPEGHYILMLANICKERFDEDLKIFFKTVSAKTDELSEHGALDLVREQNFLEGDVGVKRRGLARSRSCEKTLNPALWNTLPLELLHQLFSHLPLTEIFRLRLLSKTWDQFVTGKIPGFTKVCARVIRKVFAVLCQGCTIEEGAFMAVRLYDIDSATWHTFDLARYHINAIDGFVHTMCAGDGGLVCIVSTSEDENENPFSITVLNPLTRQWRALPTLPQVLSSVRPSMVQLVMDRDSKCYKVIVVGPREGRGGAVQGARVYSSETGQWSSPNACTDLIFGHGYNWKLSDPSGNDDEEIGFLRPDGRGPCVYDCVNSKLIELDDGRLSPWDIGAGKGCYALVKDKVFMLLKDNFIGADLTSGEGWGGVRYSIYEYQVQACQPHWVKRRVHKVHSEFENPPFKEYYMHLFASNDFLLVTAHNNESRAFSHEIAWLYDISTDAGKWQAIPPVPKKGTDRGDAGAMFELQWDAVP